MTYRLGVLFSGQGSNLEAIIRTLHLKQYKRGGPFCGQLEDGIIGGIEHEFIHIGDLSPSQEISQSPNEQAKSNQEAGFGVEVVLALSNKANAKGLSIAQSLGVKTLLIPSADFKHKEAFDEVVLSCLREYRVDVCILAGFMRILGPAFVRSLPILNIHPSLLPLFKGPHGIEESYYSPMPIGGVSVHYVSQELDSGRLIAQGAIIKKANESLESYAQRIHQLEHKLYSLAILKILGGAFYG